jgi:hypothetical protein
MLEFIFITNCLLIEACNASFYGILQLKRNTTMRSIILLILTLASISLFAADEEQHATIRNVDGQYAINFYNFNEDVALHLTNANLQGSGYTWVALVKAALTTENAALLSDIEFAPEGGAFVAYSNSEIAANKVQSVIDKLSSDTSYREKCIKIATAGGYIE